MTKRRKYTREFKLSAVELVNQKGYKPAEAARNLGVDPTSIYAWIEKFGSQSGQAPAGEGALQAENRQLKKENARLLMERDILIDPAETACHIPSTASPAGISL